MAWVSSVKSTFRVQMRRMGSLSRGLEESTVGALFLGTERGMSSRLYISVSCTLEVLGSKMSSVPTAT